MAALCINTVLILCDDPRVAAKDRQLLRDLVPKTVLHFRSGSEIIDFLRAHPVDLVLLDDQLLDMDALGFLRLARSALRAASVPIVLLSRNNAREYVLDAIHAGCSAFLLRPCSPEQLTERLQALHTGLKPTKDKREQLQCARELLDAQNYDDAVAVFEAAVTDQRLAREFFDQGCRDLAHRNYNAAIIAFQNALALNDLYAEAYEGMAEAYKGMGDADSRNKCLQKAAQTHAAYDSFDKCRETFSKILKEDPDSPNPYNALGLRLRKQGDIPGAIQAYRQALKLTPDDENIWLNLAKAFFFLGDKDNARKAVLAALKRNPAHSQALEIHQKLFGRAWQG